MYEVTREAQQKSWTWIWRIVHDERRDVAFFCYEREARLACAALNDAERAVRHSDDDTAHEEG